MRSYEELEKIALELEEHRRSEYPLEVILRNDVREMIVFMNFVDGSGFCIHDRLEGTCKNISRGEAINLIYQYETAKRYELCT